MPRLRFAWISPRCRGRRFWRVEKAVMQPWRLLPPRTYWRLGPPLVEYTPSPTATPGETF